MLLLLLPLLLLLQSNSIFLALKRLHPRMWPFFMRNFNGKRAQAAMILDGLG
jgi:hypothetical protein